MASSLGSEHDEVMHAMIPFSLGGGLDLYYFPESPDGTAIATKELSPAPNEGPSNRIYGSYELVMFTRRALDLDAAGDESTPFGRVHRSIHHILNCIGPYCLEGATLDPCETGEVPAEEGLPNHCVIFDGYASHSDDVVRRFGLLVAIEIFRTEMEYARKRGARKLIDKLKKSGSYPCSDLDRKAVV